MDKLLDQWEKINREKYGQHFYDQRKHFSLFSLLVDGVMGKEALVPIANLSWILAAKWMNPFRTSKSGLTAGFKSWSQGCTTECSAELNPQVPCVPRNQNGCRSRDWVWCSKYLAPKLHFTHLRKLTHLNPLPPRGGGGTTQRRTIPTTDR